MLICVLLKLFQTAVVRQMPITNILHNYKHIQILTIFVKKGILDYWYSGFTIFILYEYTNFCGVHKNM